MECFDDQHRLPLHLHGQNCDPKTQIEMNIYKEEFTEYKNRDAISSLTSLFPEDESRDGRKHSNALPAYVSGVCIFFLSLSFKVYLVCFKITYLS